MTGSSFDGEDVVQEALMKAHAARASFSALDNADGWLLRIAHNAALDFLRCRARQPILEDEEALDLVAAADPPDPEIAETSLKTFLLLPALQRSAVILRDVLGHSQEEAAAITQVSAAALKSALQRGRERLRALARAAPQAPGVVAIDAASRARLSAYVEGFRTGDFDAVRAMLAEDVRLDLVARLKRQGKGEVGEYLGRYAATRQWAFGAAVIDGQAAMLVYDRDVSLSTPAYFVALAFDADRVVAIRDYLFTRYVLDGAEVQDL